jgi:deoxyribodipyrimidine photo-lyase
LVASTSRSRTSSGTGIAGDDRNSNGETGSGADAVPYFRVFNPVLQGEKFDPDGACVRRFVPELTALPAPPIHCPWSASPLELAAAGVELGTT